MNAQANALFLALSAVSFWASGATLTSANIDSRSTQHNIRFDDSTFLNATDFTPTQLAFHGAIGDSGSFGIQGFTPGFVVSVTGGPGIAISGLTPANLSGVVPYTATIIGPLGQTVTQSWTGTAGTPANPLTLTRDTANNTLRFKTLNSGFLKAGGTFDFVVTINGNWSTMGNGVGMTEFLAINPTFAIAQNFSFDPIANLTTFEAINNNYNPANGAVGLDFILHGVPEPYSISLFLSGLCVVAYRFKANQRSQSLLARSIDA